MESAALYVHIPFCKSKCSYCDFFSVVPPLCAANAESSANAARGGEIYPRYIDSLLDEARERRRQFGISAWRTVYIGGGTPSLLSPAQIEKLLRGLNAVCPIDSGAEITLECNPDDVTADFLRQVAALGVNRLSLGLQAMDDAPLAAVNRRARRAENLRALELINKYWIDSPAGGFCGAGGAHNAAQGGSGSSGGGDSSASAPRGNGLTGANDSLADGSHSGGSFRAESRAPDGGLFACDGSISARCSSSRNLQGDNSFGEKRLHSEGSFGNGGSFRDEQCAPDSSSFACDSSLGARRSSFHNLQSDNSLGEKRLRDGGSSSNGSSSRGEQYAPDGSPVACDGSLAARRLSVNSFGEKRLRDGGSSSNGSSFRDERSAPDGSSFACNGSLGVMRSSFRNSQSDNSLGEERLYSDGSLGDGLYVDGSFCAERKAHDGSSFACDGSISARCSNSRNLQSDNSFDEKRLCGEGSFGNRGSSNSSSSNAVPRSPAESTSGGASPCPQNGRPRRRFSVDLICGLPLQTRESFFAGLDEVLASGVDHVSLYSLTLEEGTPLFRDVEHGLVELPQSQADIWWLAAREKLEQSGFSLYEVSNFAKSGCQSAHNLAYWLMQPYVGIGSGATGTIGDFRYTNSRDIAGYMAKTAPATTERLGRNVQIFEFLMMGFRLRQGVEALEFERRFGEKLERYIQPAFGEWQKAGRAAVCGSRYALNLEGLSLLNRFLLEILP